MAGSKPAFRHLSRDSAHRQALLRNLIDKLFEHETITTTWPKAKEAQRLAEKVISLGKENTEESRRKAQSYLYRPGVHLPKIFGTFRDRYKDREGGYTRVLRIEPVKEDQAESAILEMVDGPRDMKFALVARTLAYRMRRKIPLDRLTALNVKKVTQGRESGPQDLMELANVFANIGDFDGKLPPKKPVYPDAFPPQRWEKKRDRLMDMEKQQSHWWRA